MTAEQQEPDLIASGQTTPETPEPRTGPRAGRAGRFAAVRMARRAMAVLAGLLVLALAFAWFTRERIADDLIAGQLEGLGVPITYEVESIGAETQTVRNIVVGDPARPDLTIDRIDVVPRWRFGVPEIARITLVKPRVYGSLRDGKLSFGKLDPLIFTGSKEPFRLPDLDLDVVDGRGLMESDYGPVGIKLEGKGRLRDGFAGIVAAVAPGLAGQGCSAARTTLFGKLSISREQPRFAGPLRVAALACREQGIALAGADIDVDATLDRALAGAQGRLGISATGIGFAGSAMRELGGKVRLSWRKGNLAAHYDLKGAGIASSQVAADALALTGVVRTARSADRIESEGTLEGTGVRPGGAIDSAAASLEASADGTLLAPMVAQIRASLRRESQGSRLSAAFVLRKTGDVLSAVVPQATLRGVSGQSLLAVSRLQLASGGAGGPRMSGNFATGGPGLPRIAGRMERQPAGTLAMQVQMPEFVAGESRLAIPRLMVAQAANGALGFSGVISASGALPGGNARNLVVPVDGNWSAKAGLALWRRCTDVQFDQLEVANLRLERRSVKACPVRGGAIVQSDAAGRLTVAAGIPALDVAGTLGQTPIRIASGPVGFAVPGVVTARAVDVALGPAANASRFSISRLDARIGKDIAGTFDGSVVKLDAVPLDLLDTKGRWRYADGKLAISEAAFRLEDRQVDDRFQPLVAQGADLTLADNRIAANALLREPQSQREIVRTVIRHDLASGGGDAGLVVDGIVFDKALQPDMITRMALGVIANAEGVVSGRGRIDWNASDVTSSGTFGTQGLDFAAAFGPVKGASGQIVFTDLLGMVTAPDQHLRLATMNPGIEVFDGDIQFELQPDLVLAVKGGNWPFLGGTLKLQPTVMNLGVAETRRYVLAINGLEVARLIEQMDMANLSATGTFDGIVPLVFDENGGRLDGGILQSRAPGGNVSYVGELTYEDLSAMANFAFDALKSLNYKYMRINLDGPLEGEIVTRVTFDGIGQGVGASRNVLTRQIAKLPIRFNVNIRAPFFQLASSMRSIYDPAYVRDPRTLGIVKQQNNRFVAVPAHPPVQPDPPIQPSESETVQ